MRQVLSQPQEPRRRQLDWLTALEERTHDAGTQTMLVPPSYVAEENYLYCNPAPNRDKRHADFRPDLDHEPDIYPGLGLPSLLRLPCCSVSLRGAQPSKLAEPMISVASCDKTGRAMVAVSVQDSSEIAER
jgi:hypothetical protein